MSGKSLFIALSAALHDAKPAGAKYVSAVQHVKDCHAVADALAEGNSAFDRERFLRDCGATTEFETTQEQKAVGTDTNEPLHVTMRKLVWKLDSASPPDIAEAASVLKDIGTDMGVKASDRAIAKALATVLRGIK